MLPISASLPGPLSRLSTWLWGGFALLALAGSLRLLPASMPLSGPAEPGPDVCRFAPPTPYDPRSGLALLAPRPVPEDARCPVCGMFPARARDWAAQVVFDNGDTQFFDSPLSLFLYLQDVSRYSPGRTAAQIAARYVTDANTGAWLAAESAIYVQGSTASGPMRAGNLPAFADPASARQFAQRRGGSPLSAQQISPALLQALDARSHRHP